ncbi:integrase core domain-containing protein [Stenotrophomonas sp. 1337]|uniref:integrase core domain-containing protein n=1 Tax=Stenotrophomonas sp. 1337 TaxID=2817757 RepID=UPI002864C431|nr:integrase core domain-containing protein [Stenotrophomonas sp. 1337]MDR6695466.1 transposase InsO family protein [Stenotrophomonas sp. 1337]
MTSAALVTRYVTLGRVRAPFLLRSDNGLVLASHDYPKLVRSYVVEQEFITPHCPQQNGMSGQVIRTLKGQCVHRHRFESQVHALRVIADWIVLQPAAPAPSVKDDDPGCGLCGYINDGSKCTSRGR